MTRPSEGREVRQLLEHLGNGITSLHPDDLVEFVTAAAKMLGGEATAVLLADFGQRALHRFGSADDADSFAIDDDGPGTAYRSERVVVEELAPTTSRITSGSGAGPEGHAGHRLWIPIMDSAERLGVLGVELGPEDPDIELWTAFASLIGESLIAKSAYGDVLALTRRAEQMTLSAEMRWATLPPLTFTSDRVQITGILEPAYDIAGDTFDYALNGNELALAVLDAMGHGIEASQIATLALGEYRRCRREHCGLADMIRSIDQVIADEFGDDRYITGQFGTLDLDAGTLEILTAGHPRPVLFRDGLDAGDLPCHPNRPLGLGLVRTELSNFTLEHGDAVLFHTDGVTESRTDGGEEFGRERLIAAVHQGLGLGQPIAEVLRVTVQALHEHAAGPLRDDASLILVRWP